MSKWFAGMLVLLMSALLALPAGLAQAQDPEGPGYGGNADQLSVTWAPAATEKLAAMAWSGDKKQSTASVPTENTGDSGAHPDLLQASAPAEETLLISGIGFGSRSEVEVAVGDSENLATRADTTGTLTVDLDSTQSAVAQPGVSVLALGRSPSGSTRTLVGAVPPKPNGFGPSELLPWIIAGAVALGVGTWIVRKQVRR